MSVWAKKFNFGVDLKQRVYTTGFENRDVVDLPAMLAALDAVLADVRFAPPEKPLEQSKNYLKLLLKDRYFHIPALGNRSAKGGAAALHNLSLGIKIVCEMPSDVILIGFAEHLKDCHRRIISDKLAELKIQTREITDWKNPFEEVESF